MEVGIAEISWPMTWYNVPKPQKIRIFCPEWNDNSASFMSLRKLDQTSSDPIEQYATLQKGDYNTPEKLIAAVNKALMNKFKGIVEQVPELHFDPHSKLAYYDLGHDGACDGRWFLDFDSELQEMLGFINPNGKSIQDYMLSGLHDEKADYFNELYKKDAVEGFRPVDVNAGYHTLYVYCNLVEFSNIGDTQAQILRILEVPTEKNFGQQVVLTYPNPFYIKLIKNEFQTIEIDIKDETGVSIPFEYGRVITVLHFKRNIENVFPRAKELLR